MGKAANGDGRPFFDESRSRWVAQWTDRSGRHKKTFLTQKEAAKFLNTVRTDMDRGTYAPPSATTLGQWLEEYTETIAPLAIKPTSLKLERCIIRKHLLPSLGQYRLQDERLRSHLQRYITQKSADMAAITLRRHKAILNKVLKEAVNRRYLVVNPMDNITMPKMQPSKARAFTAEERTRLLHALPDTTQGRALRFIAYTGVRIGECCALRWQDIDGDLIHITHSMTAFGLNEPKTEAGKRTIPMTETIKKLLQVQRIKQKEERLLAGSAWQQHDFVFASAVGTAADRNNIGRSLRNACIQAGIPVHGAHTLRHTFASLAVQNGADICSLSHILGHSNAAFTMKTYVHSELAAEQRTMQLMEKIV